MGKHLLVLVTFLLLRITVFGQPFFQRTYSYETYYHGKNVLATEDHGYVIAADDHVAYGDSGICIIKTDSSGIPVWQSRYYSPDGPFDTYCEKMLMVNDGYILILNLFEAWPNSSPYTEVNVIKIDTLGNIVWTTSFTGSGSVNFQSASARGACVTSDGGLIITGRLTTQNTSDGGVMLAKLNANGTIAWMKICTPNNHSSGTCIIQKPNGNFLVAGSSWALIGYVWSFVFEVDSSGNILWARNYESWSPSAIDQYFLGNIINMALTSDGGFITTGEPMMMMKCDSIGNVQWSKSNGIAGRRIFQLPDESFVIAGRKGWFANQELLAKYDSNGYPLWINTYDETDDGDAMDMCLLNNGGYALIGHHGNSPSSIYLLTVDSLGSGTCYNIADEDSSDYYVSVDSIGLIMQSAQQFDTARVILSTAISTIIDSLCTCPISAANFVANVSSANLSVDVVSTSGYSQAWYWDFGDGFIDTVENPLAHYYTALDTYTVCLIGENFCGLDTVCQQIEFCNMPTANFSVTSVDDQPSIYLSDSSLLADIWFWNFGDGNYSTASNPGIHSYDTIGNYIVCLGVTNSCGSDAYCDTISVCLPPIAAFALNVNNATMSVTIIDSSTWVNTWLWDFGDNVFSSQNNPPWHIYDSVGTYTICLTVTNNCGADTLCETVNFYTSADMLSDGKTFSCYPNPVEDYFVIQSNTSFSYLQLVNTLGEVVMEAESTKKFDVSRLPRGLYSLQLYKQNSLAETRKIVLQ